MDAIERRIDWARYEDELAAGRAAALADALLAARHRRRVVGRLVRAVATVCGVLVAVWVVDAVLAAARHRTRPPSRSA